MSLFHWMWDVSNRMWDLSNHHLTAIRVVLKGQALEFNQIQQKF